MIFSNLPSIVLLLLSACTFASVSEFSEPCHCQSWLDEKLVELPTLGFLIPQLYNYGCEVALFCRWDGQKDYDQVGIQTMIEVDGKEITQTYLFNGTKPNSWSLDKDFGVQCDEKSKKWKATQFPDSYVPTNPNLPFSAEQKIKKVLCFPK